MRTALISRQVFPDRLHRPVLKSNHENHPSPHLADCRDGHRRRSPITPQPTMKIPIPIQPARVDHSERDLIPIRLTHILSAVLVLPAIGSAAYIIARIILSIPTP